MEIESDFTDEQRNTHYLQIANTLNYIESNGRVTEDWMEENKKVILKWREWIPDFTDVNGEVEDGEFRRRASQTETLITYLFRSIKSTGTFDVKVYGILLSHMKYMCEYLFSEDELNDLVEMMSL